jgi:hypothetical protein
MNFNLISFLRESYLQWITLIFAISLLIWGALRIRAYFLEESDTTDDNYQLLKQLREMKTQGELQDTEYRKLKSRINLEQNLDSDQDAKDA